MRLWGWRVAAVVTCALGLSACGRGRRAPARPAPEAPQPTQTAPAAVASAPDTAAAPPRAVAAPAPRRTPPRPAFLMPASDLDSATAARVSALAAGGVRVDASEVGYYLDVQEARLRQVGGDRIVVLRQGESLLLQLPSRFAFDVGSAQLVPAASQVLTDLAAVLADFRASVVIVMGHTDSTGAAAVNQSLSEQRAVAVARQLSTQGVAAERLVAVGFGDTRPLGDNASAEGRERNRRVELRITLVR